MLHPTTKYFAVPSLHTRWNRLFLYVMKWFKKEEDLLTDYKTTNTFNVKININKKSYTQHNLRCSMVLPIHIHKKIPRQKMNLEKNVLGQKAGKTGEKIRLPKNLKLGIIDLIVINYWQMDHFIENYLFNHRTLLPFTTKNKINTAIYFRMVFFYLSI